MDSGTDAKIGSKASASASSTLVVCEPQIPHQSAACFVSQRISEAIPTNNGIVTTGYKAFGSFHSDNVEDMIKIPDYQWKSPARAVNCEDLLSEFEVTEFGIPCRRLFYIDDSWTFINHGAFGGASKFAMKLHQRWEEYGESQPLKYIDRELFALIVDSLRHVAEFVGSRAVDLTFVPNATYALTSLIKNAPSNHFESVGSNENGVIFLLDLVYGSVKVMCEERAKETNETIVIGKTPVPCSSEVLISAFESQLPSNTSLLVLDHIASNSAIQLPIDRLCRIARTKAPHATIIIDGAHGLITNKLELDSLDADAYVTNFHKWFSSPKGLGLLWAREKLRNCLKAPIISHGYRAGFLSQFIWDGCRDYSLAVSVRDVLRWWKRMDVDRARDYCRKLLVEGINLLQVGWGTDTHASLDCYSLMGCVALPVASLPPAAQTDNGLRCTAAISKACQDALHFEFQIEVPVKTLAVPGGMRSFVRISSMIYNCLDDYIKLRDSVLQFGWIVNPVNNEPTFVRRSVS